MSTFCFILGFFFAGKTYYHMWHKQEEHILIEGILSLIFFVFFLISIFS